MRKSGLTLFPIVFSTMALADDAMINNQLAKFGVSNIQISDSPIAGLRTVVSDQGIFYASEDGQYFLQGALIQITENGPKDLSTLPLQGKLATMEKEMITYPAADEKYVVTVFTDISCPYCVKLHKEMQDYNDLGITIRYLAFPRAGADSKIAHQMETIWTAKNPNEALDTAKNGTSPTPADSVGTVAKQYTLGVQFGINGTPALILPDGQVYPGYVEPKALRALLDENAG